MEVCYVEPVHAVELIVWVGLSQTVLHVVQVDAIPPAMFLEAAVATHDIQKLSSVFRFYLDFLPGFQQTPDFNLYSSRLNQQCTVGNGC